MIEVVLNVAEGLWVVSAVLGMAVCLQNLHDARADQQYLAAYARNGARQIVARTAVRRERLRLLTLGFFALVGLVILTRSWLVAAGVPGTAISVGIRLVVVVAILQILVVSLLDRRDRASLLRRLDVNSEA